MKARGEQDLSVKQCFIDHGVTWMNPKTSALRILDEANGNIDPSRLAARKIDTAHPSWSERPFPVFLNSESSSSSCLKIETPEEWKRFQNDNIVC